MLKLDIIYLLLNSVRDYLDCVYLTPYGKKVYTFMAEFGVEFKPFESHMLNKCLPLVANKYCIEDVDLDVAYAV